MTVSVLEGDAAAVLATLPAASARCCVTSPPYFGLRDYGVDGQIGLEGTPDAYVERLVEVFRAVRRVLHDDGTLWLNIGDSYAASGGCTGSGKATSSFGVAWDGSARANRAVRLSGRYTGAKPKDLLGIPWMVAFALRADGWYLRKDIIWNKPNAMPESVRDRPTSAHEYLFLLSKSERYFYDAAAIREPEAVPGWDDGSRTFGGKNKHGANLAHGDRTTGRIAGPRKALRSTTESRHRSSIPGGQSLCATPGGGRNARSVWTIPTQPYAEAHFATMAPRLAERCILAGSAVGDTVLDPFGGAGTTGLVADRLQRSAVLVELNPDYAALARRRITRDAPLLAAQ